MRTQKMGAAAIALLVLGSTIKTAGAATWTFDFTDAAETFIAPISALYDISAYGAAGGASGGFASGGWGAEIVGEVALNSGEAVTSKLLRSLSLRKRTVSVAVEPGIIIRAN